MCDCVCVVGGGLQERLLVLWVAVETVHSLTHALITFLTYIRQLRRVRGFIHFDSLAAGVTRAPVDHLPFLRTYIGAYVPGDTCGVSAATVRTCTTGRSISLSFDKRKSNAVLRLKSRLVEKTRLCLVMSVSV